MRKVLGAALAGAAVAALVFVAVLYLADLEIVGERDAEPEVTVPDLIGSSPNAATAEVRALGLEARGRLGCSESPFAAPEVVQCGPGPITVTDQTPDAGSQVVPGATVTLVVEQPRSPA